MSILNPTQFSSPVEAFDSRRRRYPMEFDPEHFVERRVYHQDARQFLPLPRGAQAPDDTLYLIAQGEVERKGHLLKFWRDYANIPQTHRRPDTYTYEFIGLLFERDPFVEPVNAEVEHEYFLPGVSAGVTTIGEVPVVARQKYHVSGDETNEVRYLNDGGGVQTVTVPSRADYKTMVAAGTEIVAEDSGRVTYLGPIIERTTVYIKAQ